MSTMIKKNLALRYYFLSDADKKIIRNTLPEGAILKLDEMIKSMLSYNPLVNNLSKNHYEFFISGLNVVDGASEWMGFLSLLHGKFKRERKEPPAKLYSYIEVKISQ